MNYNDISKKEKNSRIELLKIISMVLIVFYHTTDITNELFGSNLNFINRIIHVSLSIWGALGVHLFVLISSWYLCDQKFRFKKVLDIIFQYISYILIFDIASAIIRNQGLLFGITKFGCDLLGRFDSSSGYWFVTAYVLMYLLSPLLNKVSEYKNFKQVLVVISFIPIYCNFAGKGQAISSTVLFVYLYLLTTYIKRNSIKFKYSPVATVVIVVVLIALNFFEDKIVANDFVKYEIFKTIGNKGSGSFMIIILSYAIFLKAIYKESYSNKIIDYIGSFSLGVYCFHNNVTFNIVDYVFEKCHSLNILTNQNFYYSYILITLSIIFEGIVFEIIRRNVLQKPFNFLINKYVDIEKFDNWINSI